MKLEIRPADGAVRVVDLPDDAELILGSSEQADCVVAGEPFLSRKHATLRCKGRRVQVTKLSDAQNAIFHSGQPSDAFRLRPGECFVIGATAFFLLDAPRTTPSRPSPKTDRAAAPTLQFTLTNDELRAGDASADRLRLLDLLELPEVLRTKNRHEFFHYACAALRSAAGADWVQVIRIEGGSTHVLAEDAIDDRELDRPTSNGLITTAIDEAPGPAAAEWNTQNAKDVTATMHEGVDWAVCCAMDVRGEPPTCLYVAGTSVALGTARGVSGGMTLRDTARLVGLVADMVGRSLAMDKLEAWKSRLGHFFSSQLFAKILESDNLDALSPRITEATVMFFDIRGFSRKTEGNLERILEYEGELRRALTAMTHCVVKYDGIVLRYMGDGFMACWNTPYSVADHAERACLAAIEMAQQLSEVTDGWECGIGLGMGDVVAGSLGSEDVYAYDLLGEVANQASRVEGITKAVGVPILVTRAVADSLSANAILTRRVARFLPVGTTREVDLFTIHQAPDSAEDRTALLNRFDIHAQALDAFERGDWDAAFESLHPIVREDAAARFVYTLALQRKPPPDWHGVVTLTTK